MGSPPGVPHKGARDGRGWPCRGGGGREAVTSTTLYTCSISWILYGSRGRGRGGPEPSCSPQIQRGSSLWCSLGFVCGSQGFSCLLARLICMHHPQGHPPPRSGLRSRLPGTSSRVRWGPWLGVSGGITAGERLQVPIPPPGSRTCLTCANPHIHSLCPQLLTPSRLLLQPTAPPLSLSPSSTSLSLPPHPAPTFPEGRRRAARLPTPPELSSPQATANSSPGGGAPRGPAWPRPGLRSNSGPAPPPGPPLTSS